MSDLLINERPLIVSPLWAKELGSIERALVLCQIYWITQQPELRTVHGDFYWAEGTYEEWCEQYFTMWSPHTLRKHVNWLEASGYLISIKLHSAEWDHTKAYRVARIGDEK